MIAALSESKWIFKLSVADSTRAAADRNPAAARLAFDLKRHRNGNLLKTQFTSHIKWTLNRNEGDDIRLAEISAI